MRFAHARQGLINAASRLKKHTQVNNIYTEEGSKTISWRGRKPGIVKGLYYPLEYQFLIDSHQYSLLLEDGSFFQFFYSFNQEDRLISARLAFYPRPVPTTDLQNELLDAAEQAMEHGNDELYEHLYNWTELMEVKGQNPSNTSHIRFDYDEKAKSHSPSHLQLSGLQELRLSANYFPQPLAFIQLCEASLPCLEPLTEAEIGFEKNHSLLLKRPSNLICLAWHSNE